MAIPPDAHTAASSTRASARTRHLLGRGALALLLATCLLWVLPFTSASSAAPTKGLCLFGGSANCANALAIARAADRQEETEDEQSEREEAEEEVASAQAEAEEEAGPTKAGAADVQDGSSEANSPETSSPSSRQPDANGPVISRLTLTAKATAALKHSKPPASAVGFSFMLSAPAKVQVTLVVQTSRHGHKQWTTLPDSLTTNAGEGPARRNLSGHNRLSPGRYRLTVKPVNGRSYSIYLDTSH